MNKILLDTSIIIDFLRQKDKKNTALFRIAEKNISLCISIITHTELYAGKSVWENSKAQEELKIIFSGMEIIDLNKEISKNAGWIKAKYSVHLFDAIIASTAITHNIPIATLNVKDFRVVKDLDFFDN